MILAGKMVKIPDIGPLVKCLKVIGGEALLELCGEQFWFPVSILEELEDEE